MFETIRISRHSFIGYIGRLLNVEKWKYKYQIIPKLTVDDFIEMAKEMDRAEKKPVRDGITMIKYKNPIIKFKIEKSTGSIVDLTACVQSIKYDTEVIKRRRGLIGWIAWTFKIKRLMWVQENEDAKG